MNQSSSSLIGRAYQLALEDSLVDPDRPDEDVRVQELADGRHEYRVFLYLTGRHLYLVDSVVYGLHPDMNPNTARVVRDPDNPNCKLVLWLWGTFAITARVILRTGETLELEHYLSFGNQVRELPADRFRMA
ncbi:MAG: hypothetical protein H6590_01235 [Flavobacteriales bacterium]|nr:hypothetical protein [Flavobacteriales bacterium]MCB9178035.1 hypothetical protein [Flavobacteriales bacterium]